MRTKYFNTKPEYKPVNKIVNSLQKEIVAQCLDWLYKKLPGETWEESTKNKGKLLDELKQEFGFQLGSEAWCAMFGWGVVDRACKIVQGQNLLPKTAGAMALRDKALGTNKVICSPLPEVGAVMYRKSLDADATGHIGVVVKVEDNGDFYTIEGNVDDKVGMVLYPAQKYKRDNGEYWFYGAPMTFMWAGRFPHKGQGRSESIDIISKKVSDTTKTKYLIDKTASDTNLPKKKRKRREFR